MNEKVDNAEAKLNELTNHLWKEEVAAINLIKDILTPCGWYGCSIGTEDFADDIFYVYGEPKQNEFERVMSIRYYEGRLEVMLEKHSDWIDFGAAHISDIRFLLDELRSNLEYADGYQDKDVEYEFLIDEDGSKFNPQTSVLSGGMDIRCDYNEEALFAYKTRKSLPEITAYLISKGWVKTHETTYIEFRKGNTSVFFDDWREEDGEFVCFGTEYKPEEEPPKKEEKPLKHYAVPFLRTQWTDVYVEASSEEEAIEKAEKLLDDNRTWIEWQDIDGPEYDEIKGVEEQK